jgi:hypothetical protein
MTTCGRVTLLVKTEALSPDTPIDDTFGVAIAGTSM